MVRLKVVLSFSGSTLGTCLGWIVRAWTIARHFGSFPSRTQFRKCYEEGTHINFVCHLHTQVGNIFHHARLKDLTCLQVLSISVILNFRICATAHLFHGGPAAEPPAQNSPQMISLMLSSHNSVATNRNLARLRVCPMLSLVDEFACWHTRSIATDWARPRC